MIFTVVMCMIVKATDTNKEVYSTLTNILPLYEFDKQVGNVLSKLQVHSEDAIL